MSIFEEEDFQNKEFICFDSSSLQISLYFFLLIFFVLLNANSKPDGELSKKAILSINETFGTENNHFIINKEFLIDEHEQLILAVKDYYIESIKDIISTEYELTILNTREGLLELEITNFLFFKEDNSIKDSQQIFLSNLSSLLKKNIKGINLKLYLDTGLQGFLENIDDVKLNLSLDKLATIKGFLINQGVNNNLIKLSVDEDLSPKIKFTFLID